MLDSEERLTLPSDRLSHWFFSGFLDGSSTSLVLAGDPKQLGPVVRSRLACNMALGKSLLERVMEWGIYQGTD